ncbi:head-tail connector protein [Eubacteriales bacterium OttesenSCG-928-A19]|nr:head-tail connector protein [Eubacteriales bacterium OttesenSCG-928-A19]
MVNIDVAREWLRIDGTDNDEIIRGLLDAVPSYIEVATGMTAQQQSTEPLADTVAKFLLTLWYNAEQAEAERLQRSIDNLLKTLSVKARTT